MSRIADPGVYLLAALVACLHATFLLARKYPGRHQTSYFVSSLLILTAGTLMLQPLLLGPSPAVSPAVWATPLLCGVFLASRARGPGAHALYLAGALAAVHGLYGWGKSLMPPAEGYLGQSDPVPAPFAVAGQFDAVQRRVAAMGRPLARGFIDPVEAPWADDFGYESPVRSWHTALTGVPARRVYPYRVWTPGGPPEVAARYVRLVRVGDPEPRWSKSGFTRTDLVYRR